MAINGDWPIVAKCPMCGLTRKEAEQLRKQHEDYLASLPQDLEILKKKED